MPDPSLLFLERILLSLGVGGLIGAEREYTIRQRIIGIRTFALLSLLGCLSVLLSQPILLPIIHPLPYLPYLALLAAIGYAFLVYYFLARKRYYGITTVLCIPLTLMFGILIGFGFYREAVAGALITTTLLYLRRYSHLFVQHLTETEMADALQFAILIGIIYPFLPQTIDFLNLLFFPKFFVEVVILVSLISLSGFLAIRFFGQKALPLAGFLGGLVNSLAVVVTYAKKASGRNYTLLSGMSAAFVGMLMRDAIVLLFLYPPLFSALIPTIAIMVLPFLIGTFRFGRRLYRRPARVEFQQPFSVLKGAEFAVVLFMVMVVIDTVLSMGSDALILASFLGGVISSASVIASTSIATASGKLAHEVSRYVIFASFSGSLISKGVVVSILSPNLRDSILPFIILSLFLGLLPLL